MDNSDFIVPDIEQRPPAPKPVKIPRTAVEHLEARRRTIESVIRGEKEICAFATKRKETHEEMVKESTARQRSLSEESGNIAAALSRLRADTEKE